MRVSRHPARFSRSVLDVLKEIAPDCSLILDPFAGTGRVHTLGVPSWGIEIEPEWAELHPRTLVGDALELPFKDASFDGVFTSPTYGNRMADHHNAKDDSKRNTYRHTLGRPLHPHNTGQLQWGPEYRRFHIAAWKEVWRVLVPGGLFVLNVSDHIRKGLVVNVADWHFDTCQEIGFLSMETLIVRTPRQRQGANGDLRVPHEVIYIFMTPPPAPKAASDRPKSAFWDTPGDGVMRTRPMKELFDELKAKQEKRGYI